MRNREQSDEPKCSNSRELMASSFARTWLSPSIPLSMAFSTQQLFLFVTAASVATFISTQVSAIYALLLTVGLACTFVLLFPFQLRRTFFYGGIGGIVILLLFSNAFLHLYYIDVPREPYITRLNAGWNGEMQAPQIQRDMAEKISPYCVTLGFVLGAAASLTVSRPLDSKSNDSPQSNCKLDAPLKTRDN